MSDIAPDVAQRLAETSLQRLHTDVRTYGLTNLQDQACELTFGDAQAHTAISRCSA